MLIDVLWTLLYFRLGPSGCGMMANRGWGRLAGVTPLSSLFPLLGSRGPFVDSGFRSFGNGQG